MPMNGPFGGGPFGGGGPPGGPGHGPRGAFFRDARAATLSFETRNSVLLDAPALLLLPALIIPGDTTSEGVLIEGVAIAWFEIMKVIQQSPEAMYQIDPWKWEEIIAGAWTEYGFDVTLTPRSGDGGKDVIATSKTPGVGSIRIFDQVKRYKPGHVVPADEVRAMLSALHDHNVSKVFVTTTSTFAPGIENDPHITSFMPNRLELKACPALLEWLATVAAKNA